MGCDMAAMIEGDDILRGAKLWLVELSKQMGIPEWAVEFRFDLVYDPVRFEREFRVLIRCMVKEAELQDIAIRHRIKVELLESAPASLLDEISAVLLKQVKPHLIMVAFCIKGALRREGEDGR